jgi:hypothetical protein
MTDLQETCTPGTSEQHRRAWEEMAEGIAGLHAQVTDDPARITPPPSPGQLLVIGSGIDSIGFSLGDEALIAGADKVLYCVADPATSVWLRRLRPDALDLYVLYGDEKIRYTTYMEMAEAQLYWVRQGLRVVVVFYGHPGIFVLSTHRAVQIARREGHRATMRAGVSALDTLCADLGVDPSHPGLQTHEATDSLVRRRRIDTSLHVVLWQVGLIGELGYRRQGYLNNNFSYFVSWLQELYGDDYQVTHYIGARYAGTEPVIEQHRLADLHDPGRQRQITGLSTFYLPPRDAVPMDRRTAVDLGLLAPGTSLVPPVAAQRNVAAYGHREMAAFSSLRDFRIPASYHWQEETEAAKFLIELRFDPALQELYRRDPHRALADARFSGLSERERGLLATRNPGSVQLAAKGYRHSAVNEKLVTRLLNSRAACKELRAMPAEGTRAQRREALSARLETLVEWPLLLSSLDHVYRHELFPWTGVYTDPESGTTVTIVGNRADRDRSHVFLGSRRVRRYAFSGAVLSWPAQGQDVPHGVLRLDLRPSGRRRVVLKTWEPGHEPGEDRGLVLPETDPGRTAFAAATAGFGSNPEHLYGRYALRRTGRFARTVFELKAGPEGVLIDGKPVDGALRGTTLTWTGGTGPCAEGSVAFVPEPILGSVELYGSTRGDGEARPAGCFGAGQSSETGPFAVPGLPGALADIVRGTRAAGGLLLWQKWEKLGYTTVTVSRHLAALV